MRVSVEQRSRPRRSLSSLARGYAAVGTDTGHQAPSPDASWALNNPKAQIDYAYRATHLVTGLAKELVREFYGKKEQRAYFVGCSNGGKMGLMEVLRYPDDYDGVVIGNFVIDRTRLMTAYAWNAQVLADTPIPAGQDAQDGLADGVIDRPDRCKFNPKVLICASGKPIFPGLLPGHEEYYPTFITGDGTRNAHPSSTWNLQDGFLRFFVFGSDYDSVKSFDVGKARDLLAKFAPDQDAGMPDMATFKARGGKLIMYHGWADHSIPPLSTVEYYGRFGTSSPTSTPSCACSWRPACITASVAPDRTPSAAPTRLLVERRPRSRRRARAGSVGRDRRGARTNRRHEIRQRRPEAECRADAPALSVPAEFSEREQQSAAAVMGRHR